jgi:hypothetical protein
MSAQAYVFDARLADDPGVSRMVAVGGDQTVDDVHGVLRQAFERHGDFTYAFRLDDGRDYGGAPGEGVDVALAGLGLRSGTGWSTTSKGRRSGALPSRCSTCARTTRPFPVCSSSAARISRGALQVSPQR